MAGTLMISHQHRCIYVHIPKTAGNSVNRVFGVGWEDHKDLRKYAAELSPEIFARYFKFAIVRNPWDRLLSDYNYQRKKSRADKLLLHDERGARRSFSEWVRAALLNPHQFPPASWGGDVSPGLHRWSPQVEWITVPGGSQVNFVLRMEKLPEDFAVLCRWLNLPPVRLPRRNRRRHFHYSWYYDDVTRDFVGSYYASDIAAFGYAFERSPARKAWTRTQEIAAMALNGLRTPVSLTSLRFR